MGRYSRTSYIYASDLKNIYINKFVTKTLQEFTDQYYTAYTEVGRPHTYLHVTKPCQNYDDSVARNRQQPLPPNQDRLIPPSHQSSSLRANPDKDASFTIGAEPILFSPQRCSARPHPGEGQRCVHPPPPPVPQECSGSIAAITNKSRASTLR